MKKSVRMVYYIWLALMVILPCLLFEAVKGHIDTANYENRELAAFPKISAAWDAVQAFPDGFTDWFNDHLPFKNQLLTLNGMIDYKVFKSSPSDTVIIGKKGWLFYKGVQAQEEDPVGDYMGTNLFTDAELEKIKDNMLAARDLLKKRGCEFVIFMAPNKERVYSEYMPDVYGEPAKENRYEQVYNYLKKNTDLTIVDSLPEIMEYKENYPDQQLYFRYDTHWNELGAYRGAKVLASALGQELPSMDQIQLVNPHKGSFDLARMIHLSNQLTYDYTPKLAGYTDKNIVESKNDASTEFRFYNADNNGLHEKLMIIGDSFSMYLSPYIASFYNNSYVAFYYNYKYSMLDKESPNIVVYETVERYLGNMLDFSLKDGIGVNLRKNDSQ